MNTSQPVICLMGPTSIGKTALAMQLAIEFPVQLVSVDSAMVYRGMDIGTAKPTEEEQAAFPHALIDVCDPIMPYSVGDFYQDAVATIECIHQQGQVPLLVGGTMQYFHRLQQGMAALPPANAVVRQRILDQAANDGWPALHAQLLKKDPVTAQRLHPNDSQRIQRALEVIEQTGKKMSDLLAQPMSDDIPYDFLSLVLWTDDRPVLHQRIADRFDLMLQQGFVDEVKGLAEQPSMHANLPSMRCVGYRQVWAHLQGDYDLVTCREKAIIATRQLAKRQFTWLRSWDEAVHISIDSQHVENKSKEIVSSYLKKHR